MPTQVDDPVDEMVSQVATRVSLRDDVARLTGPPLRDVRSSHQGRRCVAGCTLESGVFSNPFDGSLTRAVSSARVVIHGEDPFWNSQRPRVAPGPLAFGNSLVVSTEVRSSRPLCSRVQTGHPRDRVAATAASRPFARARACGERFKAWSPRSMRASRCSSPAASGHASCDARGPLITHPLRRRGGDAGRCGHVGCRGRGRRRACPGGR